MVLVINEIMTIIIIISISRVCVSTVLSLCLLGLAFLRRRKYHALVIGVWSSWWCCWWCWWLSSWSGFFCWAWSLPVVLWTCARCCTGIFIIIIIIKYNVVAQGGEVPVVDDHDHDDDCWRSWSWWSWRSWCSPVLLPSSRWTCGICSMGLSIRMCRRL